MTPILINCMAMKTSILMIVNHEKKERFLLFLFGFASTIDALWFIPFISFPDILFLFFYRLAYFMGHVKSQRVAFQDLSQRVGSGVLKSGREAVSIQHLLGRGKLLGAIL